MSLFDHILLKIFSLIVLLISIILLIIGIGVYENEIMLYMENLYASFEARLFYLLIALILLGISVRFLFVGTGRNTVPPAISQINNLGETRISITALENIAGKALQRVPGVQDFKVRVKPSEVEGNQYFIKVISDGDTPIPQITDQIQKEVKLAVEEIAGIEVDKVSVFISDIASQRGAKQRRVE